MTSYLGQFWIGILLITTTSFFFLKSTLDKKKSNQYIYFLFPKINFLIINLIFTFLGISYVLSDFSLISVSINSHSSQPTLYKLGAIWGSHEGSMILWNWVLGGYIYLVSNQIYKFDFKYQEKVISFLFFTQLVFISFTFLTSNPFIKSYILYDEGSELNPLLQDPGLIIHPPVLYLGYLSSIAVYSIMYGILNQEPILLKEKIHCLRKWVLYSWITLSIGIMLGSWWAYYELGWGGWWFWDPVENIALMPWIVMTALYHNLARINTYNYKITKTTSILAGTALVFSILGTFFVRSGLLSSVHSFISSSSRGIFILAYFIIVCYIVVVNISKYSYYAKEYDNIESKKFLMYINTLIFTYTIMIVFLGTFFPTFYELFLSKEISIGPFFYIKTLTPILPITAILMIFVPYTEKGNIRDIFSLYPNKSFLFGSYISIFIYCYIFVYDKLTFSMALIITIFAFLFLTCLVFLLRKKHSVSMSLGHLGFAWFIIATIISTYWHKEMTQLLQPGEKVSLGNKVFIFRNINFYNDSNYKSFYCDFVIKNKGNQKVLGTLFPEKRFYKVKKIFTTKSAIHSNLFSDIYASIGDGNLDNGWYIKLYYSPLLPHIWISSLILISGGAYSLYKKN